jgi:hypothetical protein
MPSLSKCGKQGEILAFCKPFRKINLLDKKLLLHSAKQGTRNHPAIRKHREFWQSAMAISGLFCRLQGLRGRRRKKRSRCVQNLRKGVNLPQKALF